MDNEINMNDQIRNELKNTYSKVRKLLDQDSKNDSEIEPYKSKYAAMELLTNMKNLLINLIKDNKEDDDEEINSMLAVVHLNQGIVAVETDELKSGQEHLDECVYSLLKSDKNRLKNIDNVLIVISALNQLGILWSKREDEAKKAKEYLEQAEKIYNEYKKQQEQQQQVGKSMSRLFGIDDPNEPPTNEIIEKLHTLTLYYLAQIYGSLGHHLDSAAYCHMTLKRQLEMNDFESVDWALNAATLSQFFMEKNCFGQARHHLSAAIYVLNKYEDTLKKLSRYFFFFIFIL